MQSVVVLKSEDYLLGEGRRAFPSWSVVMKAVARKFDF